MSSPRTALLVLAVLLVLSTGCRTHLGTLTIVSTHNVALEQISADRRRVQVEGESSTPIVLGVSIGDPSLQEAISDALLQGGGDVMLDVTVESWWWDTGFYGERGITVKGAVLQRPFTDPR